MLAVDSSHIKLLSEITTAIKETVAEKKIGLAFSGGVDSSLLAKVCDDLEYDITLLTIGFPNSHDILFAKRAASLLGLPHKLYKIPLGSFKEVYYEITKKIATENLSWKENSIAFYYIAKLAHDLKLKTVVTANGIDELFCGYNAYRGAISNGKDKVQQLMESKLENEIKMMKAINLITSEFNVNVLQPFLSNKFIEYAKTIPLHDKIKGEDDLTRKHIIRKLALEIGVPEVSATKRKKALQYGSLIHKHLTKSR